VSERWGYRWTLLTALFAVTGFIFFPFFAGNLTVFLIGELFQGMAWGVFQTMTTAYAAEVCPVPLRHYLTCYVNLCWIIGQFISSGVLVGLVGRTDVWG
jgi:SP family general alpha glucoside:H+ symporter-like MFS transporter